MCVDDDDDALHGHLTCSESCMTPLIDGPLTSDIVAAMHDCR